MPQRFLRPGIRTSPRWNAVSHRAARLYVAILTLVDDYGRYDGRPSVLWADAFAVWNDQNPQSAISPQETAADCQHLAAEKLLEFYEVDGRVYLQVVQWEEKPRNKSKWPSPTSSERLPMAADSCRNLPPSSSSSPAPAPSTTPSPLQAGVVSSCPAGQAPEKTREVQNGKAQFEILRLALNAHFKRPANQPWTYAEEHAGVRICQREGWQDELKLVTVFLNSIPEKNRQYETGWRSIVRLFETWGEVIDRARTIGAKLIAKPWMDADGIPADPFPDKLAKLSPEKQKEWLADYDAYTRS